MILYQDCSNHFGFVKKHGRQGAGLIFPISIQKTFKIFLSKTTVLISNILQKCSFGDPLPRLFKPFGFVKKHGRQGAGPISLYIYIENLKNLLVRNYWTNCNIIWQKCSFGDPLLRLFKPFGFVKKHGRQGAGLIFPIYLYRKLKKSTRQKPLDRLRYNLVEMFLW